VSDQEKSDEIHVEEETETLESTPSPESEKKQLIIEESLSEATTQVETVEPPFEMKKHIIDIFFDFIRTEEELNPVLCGYFCKIVGSMLTSFRKKFNRYAFNSENKIIESMIRHSYNRSIADLLIKILN